jgi:transcriptional regulator of acetoin/glycerol metabolism
MANDIVRDFMRLVQELDPQRPRSELHRIERTIRDLWGGQRTYVCKAAAEGKAYRQAESLAAGRPLSEARRMLGISRSTQFRLLRRRWVSSY